MRLLVKGLLFIFGLLLVSMTATLEAARPAQATGAYWLTFVGQNGDVAGIYRMLPDGEGVSRIFAPVGFTHRISWAPDGKTLSFDARENDYSTIYRIHPNGQGLRRLTSPAPDTNLQFLPPNPSLNRSLAGSYAPSFSPDGKWITFVSDREGWYGIFKMRADGSDMQRLADTVYIGRTGWSPDGKWILYVEGLDAFEAIYRMRPDGSDRELLNSSPEGRNLSPVYSPDGKTIAFVSDRAGYMNVYAMDADGRNVRLLRQGFNFHGAPHYSPDGKWIAFVAQDTGAPQIYRMRADGSAVQRLTFDFDEAWAPSWSPVINANWSAHLPQIAGGTLILVALGWMVWEVWQHRRLPARAPVTFPQKEPPLVNNA